MPDNSRGRGYLGDLGKRLQRFFQFDGEPGATFNAEAVPVLIIGDASRPGFGDQQGRRFVHRVSIGAAGAFYLQAQADIIIERVVVGWTLAAPTTDNVVDLYVAPVGAPPSGVAVPCGFSLDRPASGGDAPPIAGVITGLIAPFGSFQVSIRHLMMASGQAVNLVENPFCMARTQALVISNQLGADSLSAEIWGQTL